MQQEISKTFTLLWGRQLLIFLERQKKKTGKRRKKAGFSTKCQPSLVTGAEVGRVAATVHTSAYGYSKWHSAMHHI